MAKEGLMRTFLALSLIFILTACGKSKSGPAGYIPGGPFTQVGEDLDREESQERTKSLDRTDQTEQSNKPRVEEVVLPQTSQTAESEKPEERRLELLMNQMKLADAKISVGRHAGLVLFSATAVIEDKTYPIQLEGHLKEDSTADLINAAGTDDRFRAEVICRGEVKEKFYSCDSLFVDLYFKVTDQKFYREQLQIESEEEKAAQVAKASPAPATKAPEITNEEDDEGDHGEIPESKGAYVGRPERVKELFEIEEKQKPVTESETKSPSASEPIATPKPAPKSTPAPTKATPPPTAKSTPVPKAPVKQQSQAPAANTTPKTQQQGTTVVVRSTPKPQEPTAVVKSTPKPAPTAVAPEPVIPNPARVVLDLKDDPNRPVDQAVGEYSGGRLENALSLEFEGPHHYFSQPQEKQNYGTYDLLLAVRILAKKIFTEIFPGTKIRINDFSGARGGHLPPHAGHQNGLEADIGYLTSNSAKKVPQSVISSAGKWLNTMKMNEMWKVFKFLGNSERVSLIYINRGIKPKVCAYARSQSDLATPAGSMALRKLEAIGGHTSHFHLRMECGRYNPRCRTDGPTPAKTGC